MGSGFIDNPKTWIPYMNTKDCPKKICSLYCPQWCYIIFPPPPPEKNSSPKFSPHMIAVIGIVLSVLLLVIYYAIISKYFGKKDPPRREENQNNPRVEMEIEENYQFSNPSNNESLWYVANNGLDECLIKSIRLCKFKKGDGLIEGTDCSICLNKFEEEESLRVLPTCDHAFHVDCIDTWLRSHSNCPLCRANIIVAEAAVNVEDRQTHFGEEDIQERGGVVIEIREEEGGHQIRRSLSIVIVQ